MRSVRLASRLATICQVAGADERRIAQALADPIADAAQRQLWEGARSGSQERAVSSCRADDDDLRFRLRELAQQRRRCGYRRLHIRLRRDGITRAPLPVLALPNQRWNLDPSTSSGAFVHDQLATGRRFRVLDIVDDVTRECPAAVVDTCIPDRRVVRELADLIASRGALVGRCRHRIALHRGQQADTERFRRELQRSHAQ